MKNKKVLFGLNKNIQSSILMALVFLGVFFLINIKNASAESCSEQFGSGYTCANPDNTEAGADCKDGNGCPGPGNSNLKCCLTSKVKVPGPTDTMPCPANFGCTDPNLVSAANIGKCTAACSIDHLANGKCCPLSLFPQGGPVSSVPSAQPKHFNYILLESFPGFFNAGQTLTDLPAMILAIYKFGIWTVGIAGLFMLVIGGFMYMTSAGNTSTAGTARGIIWDALIGIVAALGAYLILYVINPDLTKLNLSFTSVDIIETTGFGAGGGNCAVLTDGPCAVDALKNTCFGANAEAASKVCNYESGGNINSASKTDIMADKNVFSWGLFQINLTQHNLNGLNCPSAFNGKDYKSFVINPDLYNKCKLVAQSGMININYACKISDNGKNWKPWANTKKACGL